MGARALLQVVNQGLEQLSLARVMRFAVGGVHEGRFLTIHGEFDASSWSELLDYTVDQ